MAFVVVDYRKGNLRSVQRGLELAGAEAVISADVDDIQAAEAIVLPGVGSFADASAEMQDTGQMHAIRERVREGVPFLGICLGMQLLFEWGSEGMPEGSWASGLGILKGSCTRMPDMDNRGVHYKVPHVGWNQVRFVLGDQNEEARGRLFACTDNSAHFYFTHSYVCEPADAADLLATTDHAQSFPGAVGRERVFGVQFHPEKSSYNGLKVMSSFVQFVKGITQGSDD